MAADNLPCSLAYVHEGVNAWLHAYAAMQHVCKHKLDVGLALKIKLWRDVWPLFTGKAALSKRRTHCKKSNAVVRTTTCLRLQAMAVSEEVVAWRCNR